MMTRETGGRLALAMVAFIFFALPLWVCCTAAGETLVQREPTVALPNAAELSLPGELQAYVDRELKATGLCRLPPGTITVTQPLRITRRTGGTLIGAGMPYASQDARTGWNRGDLFSATRIRNVGDGPAIVWDPTRGFTLSRLGVQSRDGVGVLHRAIPGWGASNNRLEQVSFADCGDVGFQAGEKSSDGNAAEIVFDQCYWHRCGVGFRVMHHQGVNYHFRSCNWDFCDVAVHAVRGGLVTIRDSLGYATETYLRIDHGGVDVSPYVIDGLAADRRSRSGHPLPVIVDARHVTRNATIRVNNVKVTAEWREGPGHRFFMMPVGLHNASCVIEADPISTRSGGTQTPLPIPVSEGEG